VGGSIGARLLSRVRQLIDVYCAARALSGRWEWKKRGAKIDKETENREDVTGRQTAQWHDSTPPEA